jgi:enoyl-CoA hydratase/carnithine racemase
LNEIKLGVPVPYLIDRILRSLNGDRIASQIMESGEFYPPARLLEMGMVDQLVSQSEVVSAAAQKALSLALMPRQAFALIKKNRVEPVIRASEKNREIDEENFLKCWFSQEARSLLKKAMEKF